MKEYKVDNYGLRVILSFLLATVFFVIVFLVTYSVSYWNYKDISEQNNIIEESLDKLEEILAEQSCSDEVLFESSRSLDIVGSKLSLLEKRFGTDDERVLEQKKLYTDLELKHYSIIGFLNEECGSSFSQIYFFYSNSENKQDESELMGSILSSFKIANPDKIMIYSLDSELDHEGIAALKEEYDILDAPLVVVEESEGFYLSNIRELENIVF